MWAQVSLLEAVSEHIYIYKSEQISKTGIEGSLNSIFMTLRKKKEDLQSEIELCASIAIEAE